MWQDFSYRLLAEFSHLTNPKSPTKTGSWLERFSGGDPSKSPVDELCQECEEEDFLQGPDLLTGLPERICVKESAVFLERYKPQAPELHPGPAPGGPSLKS